MYGVVAFTAFSASIESGTYNFVVSTMNVNIPVAPALDKPSACAGTDGYISNGYEGGYLVADMGFVDPAQGVFLGSDSNGTSSLLIDVDTGTTATQVICNTYIGSYTGNDDRSRLATFSRPLTAGAANFNANSSHRLATGTYRLYCIADVDSSGTESSGDSVFEAMLNMDTSLVSQPAVDATNQADWIVVP